MRKLVGGLALVAFVIVYMLVAMSVTASVLPGRHWGLQAVGYIFAGLIWVPLAAVLISWMSRDRKGKD
ncbi:MAG: DUF2842 domain-containing protein [Hyphomicrobiaceae bacterium]